MPSQFAVDVLEVLADGARRDAKHSSDSRALKACRKQVDDLAFTNRQGRPTWSVG